MGASGKFKKQLTRQQQRRLLAETDRSPATFVGEGPLLDDGLTYEAWTTDSPLGRVLHVIPALDDSAPAPVKRALAARREASLHGKCPSCGARRRLVADGLAFDHEAWCRVSDGGLRELIQATGWRPKCDSSLQPAERDWVDELPAVKVKVDRALAVLRSYPPLCPHLRPENDVASAAICAQHPQAGLLCVACVGPHQRSHEALDDLACDGCGQVPPGRLLKPIALVGTFAIKVRVDGVRHLLVLPIAVDFLGVCRKCRKEVAA